MGAVAAVETDALPVHEIARGRGGHPQRVVVVEHPVVSAGNASRPGVESEIFMSALNYIERMHMQNFNDSTLWTKALEDIPIEVLVKVAKDAIYTYDFFPSIAKLRQAAKDFGHSPVQVTHTLLEGTVEAPPKKIVPKVDYLEHWQTLFTDSHWQTCNYLHIDLPEPQKGEKQYTAEEVSKQCKRINAAGFRVTSVQYLSLIHI